MATCKECGNEIPTGSEIKKNNFEFCGNLCRVLHEKRIAPNQPSQSNKVNPTPKSVSWKGWIVSAIFFAVFSSLGSIYGRKIADLVINRRPSDSELNQIASGLNASLPMMLDRETQLKTTAAADGKLIYVYKLINMNADSINKAQLLEYIKNQTTSMSCSNNDSRKLINRNTSLEYQYYDKNDKAITSYLLTKKACEDFDNASN
jgi:hypothetical protein